MRSHMAIIASRERAKALRLCLSTLHHTYTTHPRPAAGPNPGGAAFLSTTHLTKCYDKPWFLLPITGRTLYLRVLWFCPESWLHCAQPIPTQFYQRRCHQFGGIVVWLLTSLYSKGGGGQRLNEHLSISVPIDLTFVATVRIKKWSPWVK